MLDDCMLAISLNIMSPHNLTVFCQPSTYDPPRFFFSGHVFLFYLISNIKVCTVSKSGGTPDKSKRQPVVVWDYPVIAFYLIRDLSQLSICKKYYDLENYGSA